MKKIGILTYHRVYNFGSLLQTYALQHYLQMKGENVEVIDYYPERLRMKKMLFHVNPKWRTPWIKMIVHLVPAVVSRLLGYLMMNSFLKKYIIMTKSCYKDDVELSKDLPDYDIYMNGSDQVWNIDTAGGVVDKVFFMAFLGEDKVKTAYAGSFGKDDFTAEQLSEIGKYLGEYKSISVRENSGLSVLEKAGITNGQWVLDPTFLLTPIEWKKIAVPMNLPKKYLLVYNLNRNPRINALAQEIAEKRNLEIVNFAHSFSFISGAKNVIYPTPNKFVTMFANADYVVTDSFHGTAFSINFGRQFICIPAPRFNSRLESVLSLVGLEKRLLGEKNDFTVIDEVIDYSAISSILTTERSAADNFIEKILAL
ncbi:MAG: polysaccharide pyruvyl transferase family protein [Eubacteriales bacterium]|nr:polysaccharide pyruvyl transferase family protein [Eubacteriales bacterium]